MIDRDRFFAAARVRPFGGSMSAEQTAGCNVILDGWEKRYPGGDPRFLAYEFATTFWETNQTIQPVREAYYLNPPGPHQNDATGPAEAFRKTLRYYPFYGRGYVQNTWEDNYRKMSSVTGRDLVKSPDDAMIPEVAATIMFHGMEHGTFTGRKLADYFNSTTDDPVNARRIINGTDKAEEIAAIHYDFLAALGVSTPAATPAAHRSVLKKGDRGDDVKALQCALGITPDGSFGPRTEEAVRMFQADHGGLVVDGIVGVMTLRALGLAH